MSSGQSSRNTPPNNRYGSESDYSKRRKNFHASSTRRDFKSSPNVASLATSSSGALSSSSAPSNAPARGEKPPTGEYSSRNRFRDSPSGGSSGLSRSSSYPKDPRYASYGKQYPYPSNYYQDRPAGAYGSFSSAKRAENDAYAHYQSARDASARDMTAASRSESTPFARDSWRSERPKPTSVSGASKSFPGSRFNPNNMPVTRPSQPSLSASVPTDYKKDRYESFDDNYTGRWKGGYRPEKHERSPSGPSGSRPSSTKERIRSSGLTNSVRSSKRSDSYYPSKPHAGSSSRYVDRYTREKSFDGENEETTSSDQGSKYGQASFPEDYQPEAAREIYEERDNRAASMELEDEDDEEDDEEEEEEEEEDEEEADEADNSMDMHVDEEEEAETEPASIKPEEAESLPIDSLEVLRPDLKLTAADIEGHIDYPKGCVFPATRLDTELEALRVEFVQNPSSETQVPAQDFTSYPSFVFNLQTFAEKHKSYIEILKEGKARLKRKQLILWVQYKALWDESEKKRLDMEEQLKVVHPADDDSRKELEAIDVRVKHTEPAVEPTVEQPLPQPARRNRRHGDLVTTEAEFQEILKSLKNEQNDDPLSKAKSVAATIPDLILDPVERHAFKFMDSNNFVRDKRVWLDRLQTDFETNFTEKEHDLFCEGFCRAPKRFGEISRYMGGLRSAEECVMHYYITKKAVNYKFLVSQHKKRVSKRSSKKKKTKAHEEASNPDPDAATTETPGNGISEPSVEVSVSTSELPVPPPVRPKEDETAEEPPKKKPRKNEEEKSPVEPVVAPVLQETAAEEPTQAPVEAIKVSVEVPKVSAEAPEVNAEAPQISVEVAVTETDATGAAPEASAENAGDEKKKQITSYWSITEVNEFPHLLNSFGSKWSIIAEKLTTKSATMVRNYFQRNAEKYGWNDIVATADERIARGTDASAEVPFSSVDNTIVVKPQKTTDAQAPKTEFNVYDATEGQASAPKIAPVKTEPQPALATAPDRPRASIMSLLNESAPEEEKPKNPPNHKSPSHSGGSLASLLNAASSPPRPGP